MSWWDGSVQCWKHRVATLPDRRGDPLLLMCSSEDEQMDSELDA